MKKKHTMKRRGRVKGRRLQSGVGVHTHRAGPGAVSVKAGGALFLERPVLRLPETKK